MMAIASASSAAAMVITKMISTWPRARSAPPKSTKVANPIRLMLTAFNMSSMDIKMRTALRLASTP